MGKGDYIFWDKIGILKYNKINLIFCIINKTLKEKEDIIPSENYDILKTSFIINYNSQKVTSEEDKSKKI